ncbi:hypothetical protein [Rhodopseudomonas sp. B29]|uniref:hypothetical protein n=1 Tax=Rhodopseudomonas sp. B29 TaxID=95607 RepID=UPI00034B9100|nr:hypothetical protein [Rhodopseudomonas sp. B29]
MTVQWSRHRTLRQIFAWPLLIAILSMVGLLSALLGDGIWDGLSWATLAVPVLLYVAFYVAARRSRPGN